MAGSAQALLRSLDPRTARQRWKLAASRQESLTNLAAFSGAGVSNSCQFPNVLIDGTWDNPNYWLRYALVRRALGLAAGNETGLLGQYSRSKVKAAFEQFGVSRSSDYWQEAKPTLAHLAMSGRLLKDVDSPDDLIQLRLPYDFPPEILFDGILKLQRRATVNINDPALPQMIADALAHIEAADRIVETGRYGLVVLSHAVHYTCAAIAWAAIQRRIPVLVLYGDFGTARFFHLQEPDDLFAFPGRPSIEEIEGMPSQAKELLRSQGADLLRARLNGQTDDVGAIYAYQRRKVSVSKAVLAERFGWDPSKPVIGVYNSNWFDFPHGSGLHYFRDFFDWIEQTLAVARNHDAVNWLFKAHPCDDWYASIKGGRLEDLIEATKMPHIRLADKSWNGQDLIRSLDGIVTCHGTIGIEATFLGTPVLASYPGWYGHAGFVLNPGSRDDYLSALKTVWWKGIDRTTARARAELFAGWIFCVPDWHDGYVLQDDSRQEAIYADLPQFLQANAVALEREVREIKDWLDSGHRYFHVFKMARGQAFQPANRKQNNAGLS